VGAVSVDGRDGEPIKSSAEMLVRFTVEAGSRVGEWESRLKKNPDDMEAIEQEVRHEYLRGAGLMIAGLTAVVMQTTEFAAASEQTRQSFDVPLAKGRSRKLAIRLFGGVVMWVTSLYCEPKRGQFRKAEKSVAGLHIELVQFGFGGKESPGLESRIARQTALCLSFDLARAELNRDGVSLSTKAVRRVAQNCGDDLLKLRTIQLEQWRAGTLASTDELKGLHAAIQIDGGRTGIRGKLRETTPRADIFNEDGFLISDAAGWSKPVATRTFFAGTERRDVCVTPCSVRSEFRWGVGRLRAVFAG